MVPNIELVAIVWRKDLPNLEMLIRSTARFANEAFSRVIIVAQASKDDVDLTTRVRSIAAATGCASLVVAQRSIVAEDESADGWVMQQILKIAAARIVGAPYYLLLDCKNHFINTFRPSDFFHNGKPKTVLADNSHHEGDFMGQSLRSAFEFFGLDPNVHLHRSVRPVTPFLVDTGIARDLMSYVETRTQRSFASAFISERFTEFFLYNSYIVHRWGAIDEIYSHDQGLSANFITVWGKCLAEDPRYFDACLDEKKLSSAITFAVHKAAKANLTPEQRDRIASMWVDRGIASRQDAHRLLLDVDDH